MSFEFRVSGCEVRGAWYESYQIRDLTEQEKRGLETFIEVGCSSCHLGVLLGGNMYQKFGLFHPYHELTGSENIDKGRASVTNNESDSFMFKVPSMHNIAETYPYFHDGSIANLEEALQQPELPGM